MSGDTSVTTASSTGASCNPAARLLRRNLRGELTDSQDLVRQCRVRNKLLRRCPCIPPHGVAQGMTAHAAWPSEQDTENAQQSDPSAWSSCLHRGLAGAMKPADWCVWWLAMSCSMSAETQALNSKSHGMVPPVPSVLAQSDCPADTAASIRMNVSRH